MVIKLIMVVVANDLMYLTRVSNYYFYCDVRVLAVFNFNNKFQFKNY